MDMLASPEGTTASLKENWRQKLLDRLARRRAVTAGALRTEAETEQIGHRGNYAERLLELERDRLAQEGRFRGEELGLRRELGTGELGLRKEAGALAGELGRGQLGIAKAGEARLGERQAADLAYREGGEAREERRFQRQDPRAAFLADEFARIRADREAGIGAGRMQPGGDFRGEEPLSIRELMGLPSPGERRLRAAEVGARAAEIGRGERGAIRAESLEELMPRMAALTQPLARLARSAETRPFAGTPMEDILRKRQGFRHPADEEQRFEEDVRTLILDLLKEEHPPQAIAFALRQWLNTQNPSRQARAVVEDMIQKILTQEAGAA
jgi:hypothetical protein